MKPFAILTFLFCQFVSLGLWAAPTVEAVAPPTQPSVGAEVIGETLGFQDWKQKRVLKARADLEQFKLPQEEPTAENAENVENLEEKPETPQIDNAKAEKLRQLEFNLEIAQGLTIHDYFALYLKNKSKEEMARAVEKLSPEELSELLVAYRSSLYGLPAQKKATPEGQNKKL